MLRTKTIDCMKGLGILLVVIVHAGIPHGQYIELFHMAVFFIISGYCHNETYSENIQSMILFLKKRLKSLYFPYIISNFVLLCFHNVFYNCYIYTDNPLFLRSDIVKSSYGVIGLYSVKDFIFQFILTIGFVGGEQLGGVLWFLRTLFEVEIFFVLIDWISKKLQRYRMHFHCIVFVIILLLSYVLNTKGFHIITGIETTCYYFAFFVIGILLQKGNLWRTHSNKIMLLISLSWILIHGFFFTHSLVYDVYFPTFYIMNGVMGGAILYNLSRILMSYRIGDFFAYMGRHSRAIMLWHFLAFKIVTFCYIKIWDLPEYYLASFPFLQIRYLWIIYTFIGVALPLLTVSLFEIIKSGTSQHLGL